MAVLDSAFDALDSRFFVSGTSIVSAIPDSLDWIPDSKA